MEFKIESTFTVDGETFGTEQEAMDHAYYLERRAKVMDLFQLMFPEKDANNAHFGKAKYSTKAIVDYMLTDPAIFREALDIIEGK
tara:strand:- start:591 stop:845 length:255 start_codon:yes stop_codon:yes gene_type:complete